VRRVSLEGDGKIQSMASQLRADDIVPLIAALTPQERARLLRLIVRPQGDDASLYDAMPAAKEEFSSDEEPLAWEGDEWENVA
jgi:hypothetical protein